MATLGRSPGAAPLTSADIPDSSITAAKIATGAITAADVAADMATQAELDTVSTVASAALPKAGGAMTGAITTNSTFDGIDIGVRDALHAPKASPTFTGTATFSGDIVPSTPLSHRNVIINGAMQVAQRGTSATGKTLSGVYAVDRMALGMDNLGTWTVAQETLTSGNAYNAGFKKAFRIDCTTADASPASGNNLFFQYKIEGQDLNGFKKGTSEAEQFTLQFWVKSNKTGTGQVVLFDNNSRAVGLTYTISSGDTWEHKKLTFPADTSGAFANDNTKCLEIEMALDAGSDFQGGTLPATWSTSNNNFRSINDFALGDNTANDWSITGIQLERGSNATPFEHRSYGEELIRCMRYYESHNPQNIGSNDYFIWAWPIATYNTGHRRSQIVFKVTKRIGNYSYGSTADLTLSGTQGINAHGFMPYFNGVIDDGSGGTTTWYADAEL